MPFLAPIGIALTGGALSGTAAAIVGGLSIASAGVGVASGIKSLVGGQQGGGGSGGGGVGTPPALPSIPSLKQAEAAATQQIKQKKRRATTRVATSQAEQTNLLANPSVTQKTLLGG